MAATWKSLDLDVARGSTFGPRAGGGRPLEGRLCSHQKRGRGAAGQQLIPTWIQPSPAMLCLAWERGMTLTLGELLIARGQGCHACR